MQRALKKNKNYSANIGAMRRTTEVRLAGSTIKEKIRVELESNGNRGYDVIIGVNNLDEIGHTIKNLNIGDNIFLLSDSNVGPLYAEKVIKSLKSAGFSDIGKMFIKAGEESKIEHTANEIREEIYRFDKKRNKNIIILTLGGGVVGDLGGYVAGSYRRGIHYIQIPTSLLGQVDCGLGGKVAINFNATKNLIGLFYQPKLVFMDLSVLKTLDPRELKSGFAEVIKYGVIEDSDLFKYIEKNTSKILDCDLTCLKHVVSTCVRIKARIVREDERDEKDIRIMLNFGHTIGHAIEAASNYKLYTHGEAISIGMLCAGAIAHRLKLFSKENLSRLNNMIIKAGLSEKIKGCTLNDIMRSMVHDKKFVGGVNRFVLPIDIGKTKVKENIDENPIKDVITERMES